MAIPEKPWQPLGKKQNFKEGRGKIFFEVIVRDETGRKLDNFVFNSIQGCKDVFNLIIFKFF